MAPLNELFVHAREARRQTILLRADTSRLTRQATVTRLTHVARRESCLESLLQAKQTRQRVPSWRAWEPPTRDLRLTLVPLD